MYPGYIFLQPLVPCDSMSCQISQQFCRGAEGGGGLQPCPPACVSTSRLDVWPNQYSEMSICPGLLLLFLCPHTQTVLQTAMCCRLTPATGLIMEQHRKCDATSGGRWHFNLSLVIRFVKLFLEFISHLALFAHSADDFSALLRNAPPQWPWCSIAAYFSLWTSLSGAGTMLFLGSRLCSGYWWSCMRAIKMILFQSLPQKKKEQRWHCSESC